MLNQSMGELSVINAKDEEGKQHDSRGISAGGPERLRGALPDVSAVDGMRKRGRDVQRDRV